MAITTAVGRMVISHRIKTVPHAKPRVGNATVKDTLPLFVKRIRQNMKLVKL